MNTFGFSHSSETGKNSLACDMCSSECLGTCTTTAGEENKLPAQRILESSSCSNIATPNDVSMNFLHKMDGFLQKTDGYVYKRRKLQKNGVALLSEGNVMENNKEGGEFYHSTTSCGGYSLVVNKGGPPRNMACILASDVAVKNRSTSCESLHLQIHESSFDSQVDLTEDVMPDIPDNGSTRGNKLHVESSGKYLQKSYLDFNSSINDQYSTSKCNNNDHSLCFKKNEVDTGECSSLDSIIAEPFNFHSSKELCIFVLKSCGLLRGACENGSSSSLEVPNDQPSKSNQSCKICHESGNPSQMLICDLCEEAFHVSCCKPKVRNLPVDAWYCQSCSKKRQKTPIVEFPGREIQVSSGESSCNRIAIMLHDNQPYTTGVRIGKDFQAEVLEWSGPVSDDYNPLGEPLEVDPAEYSTSSASNNVKPSKSDSIGNWVQCREVVYSSDDDEGTVCGKWRRAPLFVVQTDDWDCSCALLWDPIHADCAVPQELETEIVLKHLKFIEMLRPRLANSKRKLAKRRSYEDCSI